MRRLNGIIFLRDFDFDPTMINLVPQDVENFRPVLFLEPKKVLAVKEKDMFYSRFGESLDRINAIDYESLRFARKLRTQILKEYYGLGNLILRFPVELIDQRIFRYDSLEYIFEKARCCVEICNPRIKLRDLTRTLNYDEEIGECLQGIWHKIVEAREGNRKEDVGSELCSYYGLGPSRRRTSMADASQHV
jgi:hypothetical protein